MRILAVVLLMCSSVCAQEFGKTVFATAKTQATLIGEKVVEMGPPLQQKFFEKMEAGKELEGVGESIEEAFTFFQYGNYFLNLGNMLSSIAQTDNDFLDATKEILRAKRCFERAKASLLEVEKALE